jgi:hypothetical protein
MISHCADEYLLELSNFRDSVAGISKLSPIFGGIIEELKKYAVVIHQYLLQDLCATLQAFQG